MLRIPAFGLSLLLLAIAGSQVSLAAAEPVKKPPNLIVILADDFGYECVGANGGASYKTPNLDKLAATGVRFEHGYAQPLCTPTRVQLMTGIYNVRNYVEFGLLDKKQTTFGHLLKKAGYATGMAGKWQLGRDFDLPKHFGFDDYCLWQLTRRPPRYANPGLEINGKAIDYAKGEYGPDLVNDFALDFCSRHKDKPFVLYYSMMLTHAPFQPTPDSPGWDPKAMGEKVNNDRKHFGDMVAYMDKLIGKLVNHLEKLKLRDNTLILFTGDNGTGKGITSKLNGRDVKGGKGDTTDGGTRVPLIANWPGIVQAGKVSKDLVDSTDFLPTMCDAAGVAVPKELAIDGRSFWPQLRGDKGSPREWTYCWYARDGDAKTAKEFARNQRYKLYRTGEFYDISADSEEMKPLKDLDDVAAGAKQMLQTALDKYKDARPARLQKPKKD